MQLFGYWRSSSAYRVRIALELKGLTAEHVPVHLVRDGGEQHRESYRALNPQGRVPTLVDGDAVITQSLAICEYLEERFADTPPLLPGDAAGRARVRALATIVASDVQPLQNLSVLKYLAAELEVGESARVGWIRHWIAQGFAALEARLGENETGDYSHGDSPGLADCFLVPQVYNAERYECDLGPYPQIREITARCRALPAFERAAPENQPDAPG